MASFWEHTKKERPIFGLMGYGGGVGSSLIAGGAGAPIERSMWICGPNYHGQLGLNQYAQYPWQYQNYSSPMQIGTNTNWAQIFRGGPGSMAITNTNELFSWGNNGSGNVGNNTSYPTTPGVKSPTKIPGSWKYAYVGNTQRCAITTGGELFTWGQDKMGCLGQNESPWTYTDPTDYEQYQRPNECSSPISLGGSNWKMAQVREWGGGGVKDDGTAWYWGQMGYGSSGANKAWDTTSSPVQMGGNSDYWKWINFRPGGWSNGIKQVPWGTTGTYYVWGYSGNGSLGMNEGGYDGDYSSPMQVPGVSTLPEYDVGASVGGITLSKKPSSIIFSSNIGDGGWVIDGNGSTTGGQLWTAGSGGSGNLGLNESWTPGQPWAQYPRYSSLTQVGTQTDWSLVDDGQIGWRGDKTGTDVSAFVWGGHSYGTLGINCGYNPTQPWSHCKGRSSPTAVSGPGIFRDCAGPGFRLYEA